MNAKTPSEVMPQFSKESAAKMISIDLMSAERFGAQRLLEAVEREFPIGKVMPPDFKGHHTLALVNGKLQLNLWVDNHVWPLTFEGGLQEPPRTTIPPSIPKFYT